MTEILGALTACLVAVLIYLRTTSDIWPNSDLIAKAMASFLLDQQPGSRLQYDSKPSTDGARAPWLKRRFKKALYRKETLLPAQAPESLDKNAESQQF